MWDFLGSQIGSLMAFHQAGLNMVPREGWNQISLYLHAIIAERIEK